MEIEKAMKALGLGALTAPPVRVDGGLLHKMYHVTTSEGDYAFKLLNPEIMGRPDALSNMIRSERIAEAFAGTVPVVSAVRRKEKQVQELQGEYYMVFPWVQGTSVFGNDITDEHCAWVGGILGKLHRKKLALPDVSPQESAFELFDWDGYLQRVEEQENGRAEWVAAYRSCIKDVKRWNREAHACGAYLSGHQVISHRDLDPKNVLWKDGEARVIDWESTGYVNPFQELLEVLNYWCDDGAGALQRGKFEALLNEYRKYMETDGVNWAAVFGANRMGMLGWLEYSVKRALGMGISDEAQRKLGADQVLGTVRELYAYQGKLRQIAKWMHLQF